MSADELYHRARQVDDPALADRLAARAILADPDHALAYALRGHLAARRGDPIVAAHYFRVAYTRGDRADATRAALAACLDAAGEHAVADRLRADAALPPELADFAEGLAHHGPVLRQILSTRLPPAGQPALLPGEKPPSDEVAARDDALVARMAPARRSPLGSERPADHRPPPARVARPPLPSGAGRELDAEPERPPLPGRTPPRAPGSWTENPSAPASGAGLGTPRIPAPASTGSSPGVPASGLGTPRIPAPASTGSSPGLPASGAGLGAPRIPAPASTGSSPGLPAPAASAGPPGIPAPLSTGGSPGVPEPLSSARGPGIPAPASGPGLGAPRIPAPLSTSSSPGIPAPASAGSSAGIPAPASAAPHGIPAPAPAANSAGHGIPAPAASAAPHGIPAPASSGIPAPAAPRAAAIPAPAEDLARDPDERTPLPDTPRAPLPDDRRVVRHTERALPTWLEPTAADAPLDAPATDLPSWLETTAAPAATGPARVTPGAIELTADPGLPTVTMRSPVTGRLVDAQAVARARVGATMPELDRPDDPLEARPRLLDLVDAPRDLQLAVHLPGPVITAPGARPRQLCDRVALGLTPTEVILRDADTQDAPPARVPLRAIRRLEVVADGAQLSLHLHDDRQIHLDLRALRKRSPLIAARVVDAIADALS